MYHCTSFVHLCDYHDFPIFCYLLRRKRSSSRRRYFRIHLVLQKRVYKEHLSCALIPEKMVKYCENQRRKKANRIGKDRTKKNKIEKKRDDKPN